MSPSVKLGDLHAIDPDAPQLTVHDQLSVLGSGEEGRYTAPEIERCNRFADDSRPDRNSFAE
jgi:hypothetical protein